MKIKDASGKTIAEINLESGFSLNDLVKSISNKNLKSCFESLEKIEESEDKKQIVFKFKDGEFFYDLPSKIIVKKNGLKIGDASLSKTKFNVDNKKVKIGYHKSEDTFWLELANKTDVVWIKTFFYFVDIWANLKHKTYIDQRVQSKRCKVQILNFNKEFFDSIESFSKIPQIQKLSKEDLIEFYNGILDYSKKANEDFICLDFKKSKLDNWFLGNINERLSENYFQNQTLVKHVEGYISCIKNGLRDQFRYVFETYRGALNTSQVKTISNLIKMGYEPMRLIDYLFRDIYNQGLDLGFNSWGGNGALDLLFDYANMNVELGKDYEKYPRYLSTLHNVTAKNYRIKEDEILDEKFKKVIMKMKKENLAKYSDDEYVIVLPNSAEDLVGEGQSLQHCVASYYKRMANDETTIVFLRKKESPNQSLVTIEIKNKVIVQAKGKNNSEPKDKEKDFIKKYQNYLMNV